MGDTYDIVLESLGEGHLPGLRRLYKLIFNKEVEEEYFRIKYGLDKEQQIQFATVALLNEEPVGFMGALDHEFISTKDKIRLIGGCDYFLLNDYRGSGLFNTIYNETLRKAKEQKVNGIFAIQSGQTHKVSKKLGWQSQKPFNRFHIEILPFSTARIFRLLGLDKWRIDRLSELLFPYSTAIDFNIYRPNQMYSQNYNFRYFRQKAFCQRFMVDIASCLLYLKYDYVLSVGFCHFKENAKPMLMIETLKRIARNSGIHDVVFQVHCGTTEAQILGEYLTPLPSFKVDSLLFDEKVNFNAVKLNFMDMDVF